MVKVKGKIKAKVKRKAVKAGSKNVKGGFPTEKVIKINTQIKKNNNG